ncbi:hypothetical protein AAE478_009087 [Parahypoxylon ruwenzoriense]
MTPNYCLSIPIPLPPAAASILEPATRQPNSSSQSTSEPRLQLKAIVNNVTSNPSPEVRGTVGERCSKGELGSNYGDDDDEPQATKTTTQQPRPNSTTDRYGMWGPGSYAKYSINSDSCVDSIASSCGGSYPKPEPGSHSSLLRLSSQMNMRVAKTPIAAPLDESMDETLTRLSNNFNHAHSVIQAEESAALLFLRELCA